MLFKDRERNLIELWKKLKTLPSGWLLRAGAVAQETAPRNIIKTCYFEGAYWYHDPKNMAK